MVLPFAAVYPGEPMSLIGTVLFLLLAARVGGELAERVGQPAMIGELLAGVVLGPMVFGLFQASAQLRVISELGVFFLVLLAGLELSPDLVWRSIMGGGLKVAVGGFTIPLFLGWWVGWMLGLPLWQIIFLGLCVAITALPISIRLAMDTNTLNTPVGQCLIAVAVVNDIVALVILGVVLEMAHVASVWAALRRVGLSLVELLLFVCLVLFVNRIAKTVAFGLGREAQGTVKRWIEQFKGQETLFALTILLVLVFARIAETLGLHFLIGAFLGGVILSRELMGSQNFGQVKRTTSSITMGFLAPIFFAHIGLEMSADAWRSTGLMAVVLLTALAGKLVGGYLGARWAKFSVRNSAAIGVGLNGRGTMDLVIATIALERGLISRDLFSALVFMSVWASVLTPWMFQRVFPSTGRG